MLTRVPSLACYPLFCVHANLQTAGQAAKAEEEGTKLTCRAARRDIVVPASRHLDLRGYEDSYRAPRLQALGTVDTVRSAWRAILLLLSP